MKKSAFIKGFVFTALGVFCVLNAVWFWGKHEAGAVLETFHKSYCASLTFKDQKTAGYPFSLKTTYEGIRSVFKEEIAAHAEPLMRALPHLRGGVPKEQHLTFDSQSLSYEAFIWNPFCLYGEARQVLLSYGEDIKIGAQKLLLKLGFSKTGDLLSHEGTFKDAALDLVGTEQVVIQEGRYGHHKTEGGFRVTAMLSGIHVMNPATKNPYWNTENSLSFDLTSAADLLKGDMLLKVGETVLKADVNVQMREGHPRDGTIVVSLQKVEALITLMPELEIIVRFVLAPYKRSDGAYNATLSVKNGKWEMKAV